MFKQTDRRFKATKSVVRVMSIGGVRRTPFVTNDYPSFVANETRQKLLSDQRLLSEVARESGYHEVGIANRADRQDGLFILCCNSLKLFCTRDLHNGGIARLGVAAPYGTGLVRSGDRIEVVPLDSLLMLRARRPPN